MESERDTQYLNMGEEDRKPLFAFDVQGRNVISNIYNVYMLRGFILNTKNGLNSRLTNQIYIIHIILFCSYYMSSFQLFYFWWLAIVFYFGRCWMWVESFIVVLYSWRICWKTEFFNWDFKWSSFFHNQSALSAVYGGERAKASIFARQNSWIYHFTSLWREPWRRF